MYIKELNYLSWLYHCANPYYRLVNLTVVHSSCVMAIGLSLRNFSALFVMYMRVIIDEHEVAEVKQSLNH